MKKRTICLLALTCALVACSDDDNISVFDNPVRAVVETPMEFVTDLAAEPLQLSYHISTAPASLVPDAPEVHSVTRRKHAALHNAHLFQFSPKGVMFANEVLGDISVGQTISPSLTTGLEQTIYLVANIGNVDFSKVTDLATFEAMTLDTEIITSEDNIPVVGCLKGVEVVKTDDGKGALRVAEGAAKLELRHIASKIVFDYRFKVEGLELQSVALCDAPATMTFVEPVADGIMTFFPEAIIDSNFKKIAVTELSVEQKLAGEFTWYVSDNIRGYIEEYTEEQQKNRMNAPDRSTYILLEAVAADGLKVSYRIYPGGNNSGDYNIFRNRIYSVSALIDGDDPEVDSRIETDMPPIVIVPDYATPANCYMVAPGGEVSFNPYKTVGDVDNKHLTGKTIARAEILWQTKVDGELALGDAKSVELSTKGDNTFVTVKANKSAATGGNALVVVRNDAGDILWSFHIWVTPYDADTEDVTYNGETWLNRNLGALSVTAGDTNASGWLYQWGRPVPFPYAVDDSNVVKLYDANGNELKALSETPGDMQIKKMDIANIPGSAGSMLDYAIQNPLTLIYNDISGESKKPNFVHWISSDPTGETITSNLWNMSGKTIYDPCPAGYKISGADIFNNTLKHNSAVSGALTIDAANNGAYINVLDKKTVWFPYQGVRKTTGVVEDFGTNVYVWTDNSHADALRTWTPYIYSAYKTQITTPRSWACVVRCVRE